MKTISAIVVTLGLFAGSGFAQPTVTQISNAASEALAPLPNSSIAQGSYFAIYGKGFGPDYSTCPANNGCLWNPTGDAGFPDAANPLPTSILGTSAKVTIGQNAPVSVYIEFAAAITSSYSQINAIMPSNAPVGSGTLTVTYMGTDSTPFDITVVPSSVGTFTVNQAGTGPGIITDVNYGVLNPFHTAKPLDYVILWGTGLGAAPNVDTEATAPPPQTDWCHPSTASCPTVWVAGQKANIYYAGRSGFVGEDQIVFQVPSGAQGCYVQVAVQTGTGNSTVISNFTSMTVDPNGAACQDADGINYGDIQSKVQSSGKASVGAISLLSNFLNLTVPGLGLLPWDNDTVSGEIGTFSTGVLNLFQGFSLAPSVNNCTVTPFLKYPPPVDPGLSYVTYLDAGSSLSITGPNGTQPVPVNTNGKGYSGLVGGETILNLITGCPASSTNNCVPFFLSPTFAISSGTYTVTGPGGADVGALSASVQVPSSAASFVWSNQSSVTASPISRNSALEIDWTGYTDPNGFVDITAISSTLASGTTPADTTPGILAECIAPASLGKFTIPTYVLQSLPANPIPPAGPLVPPGELLVGPASAVTTATEPSGLDELYIFYHFIAGQNVTWQ